MLDSTTLINQLTKMLSKEQINTNKDDLYDAAADRYKKFAKARKVLNVPSPIAIVYPKKHRRSTKTLNVL